MGKGSGNKEAALARREEQERQARIRQGTRQIDTVFGNNFTDDFYNGLRQSYLDYSSPQLIDQYSDAKDQMAFALNRAGVTDSSIAAGKAGDLEKINALRSRELADKAMAFETGARTDVERARGELINTLNVTGDAQGAVNSAINRASVLSRPKEYDPLGNLFTEFLSGLGTQAAFERAYALGSPVKPQYNTGLFGGSSSVRNY